MTRQKREEYKLYNEGLKLGFIRETYRETTQIHVKRLLSNAYDMEMALNKDLANFNFEQTEEFLKSLNKKSVQSLYSTLSYLRRYVNYAIKKGYVPTRINYCNLFRGSEMLRKYVNFVAENIVDDEDDNLLGKYITRDELHNIIDFCYNPQDAALFGLLFEGVMGIEHEEIRNLRPLDCNLETGEITLTRRLINEEKQEKELVTRKIIIKDSIILSVLEGAIEQKIYEKNNGMNDHLRTKRFELANTGYVFRVSGRGDCGRIKTVNINNRLKKIAILYDNQFLNPKNIWISGQIDYAKALKKQLEIKELNRKYYEMINKRFGYDSKYWHTTKTRIIKYI